MTRARAAVLAAAALALGAALPDSVLPGPLLPARAAGNTPVVLDVTPAKGPAAGGTPVTITGTDFSSPMSATFGGVAATAVTVTSPTTLTCITPPHALGPVNVVVTQTTPPATPSTPAVNAFTYEDPPAYLWVPRAPGTAGSGYEVTIVDVANRRVAGNLDLNVSDPDLPDDDAWRVTQVLFDASGATAFLATAGTPGTLDSRKVFIVKTARAVGAEVGNPVLSTIDTDGNPWQIALSSLGTKLFVADAGSWAASSTNLPNGTFRAYDVTDRTAPAPAGTPADVGILPALAYDAASYQGWGVNSSFRGVVQSRGSKCVVTNAGSHTLSVVDVSTLGVTATVDVGVSGGGAAQLSTSVPSPYSDDFVFVQTTDLLSPATEYYIYRVSTGTLLPKGSVSVPMQFSPVLPGQDLQSRMAWPHPDGENMVVVPAIDASLATWNPATGGAAKRTAIQGGGPPASLALNDVSGFFYAREADGGWTVFSVPEQRGSAPVEVVKVPEATGVNSLRVVGDGRLLVGTAASNLAFVDGNPGSASIHTVVDNLPLPLDPAGGPSFPQPGTGLAAARSFVTAQGPSSGPRIVLPLAGTLFGPADAPPQFEIGGTSGQDRSFEIELGNQYDFLPVPGSIRARVRVPDQGTTTTPDRRLWLRILRRAAGAVERPFYARVNAILPGGVRLHGTTVSFRVAAPVTPVLTSPAPGASVSAATPPTFVFDPGQEGKATLIFRRALDVVPRYFGRYGVDVPAGGPASVPIPAPAWRSIAAAARRGSGGTLPEGGFWKVALRDLLGRTVFSTERAITITD